MFIIPYLKDSLHAERVIFINEFTVENVEL